jgi:Domain of unknown function (DUF4386)
MSTVIGEKELLVNEEARKVAIIAGILFIVATVTNIASLPFLGSISSPYYLTDIATNANQVLTGILLVIIGAFASASIAITFYPVLRKYSQRLSLGAVSFRLIEAVLYIISAIGLFLLLNLSQQFVNSGATNVAGYQTFGTLLLSGYHWVGFVIAPLPFALGALMYYYIFYRTRLIPRWLADWGLAAVALCALSSLLAMFNIFPPFSTTQIVLDIPIGVQEMVLAVWLIIKGFNMSSLQRETM